MPLEIERKFLIANSDWKLDIMQEQSIRQGYLLNSEKLVIRIRTTEIGGAGVGYITLKTERINNTCHEFEYQIPFEDATALFRRCPVVIVKTRYIRYDQYEQKWEIDQFHGLNHGLILAEIELTEADQDVELPSWIGKEVSDDHRYTNAYLANNSWNSWVVG